MIRSRRSAHRYVFGALAVALPVVFIAGSSLRPDVPRVGDEAEDLLLAFDYPRSDATPVLRNSGDFEVAVLRSPEQSAEVFLRPRVSALRPDVLVYWTAGSDATDVLPTDAVLIGGLAGTRARLLELPPAFEDTPGAIALYSLGHQEVIATIALDDLAAFGGGAR